MSVRAIRPEDGDFFIIDGMIMTSRACFEISTKCPDRYKQIIVECINSGWLKPIAYVKESEYIWEKLKE